MHSLCLRGYDWGWMYFITDIGLCLIFFIFIQNIPKRVNYIMKYIDSQICVSKCILHLIDC